MPDTRHQAQRLSHLTKEGSLRLRSTIRTDHATLGRNDRRKGGRDLQAHGRRDWCEGTRVIRDRLSDAQKASDRESTARYLSIIKR